MRFDLFLGILNPHNLVVHPSKSPSGWPVATSRTNVGRSYSTDLISEWKRIIISACVNDQNKTMIDLVFFKSAELPLITVITADKNWSRNSNGSREPEVYELHQLINGGHEPEVLTEQTNISTCIYDSSKIPTALPMFRGQTIRWD